MLLKITVHNLKFLEIKINTIINFTFTISRFAINRPFDHLGIF